jgi:hypothetical protein
MGATVVIKDTDCMFVRAMAQLVMRGAQVEPFNLLPYVKTGY